MRGAPRTVLSPRRRAAGTQGAWALPCFSSPSGDPVESRPLLLPLPGSGEQLLCPVRAASPPSPHPPPGMAPSSLFPQPQACFKPLMCYEHCLTTLRSQTMAQSGVKATGGSFSLSASGLLSASPRFFPPFCPFPSAVFLSKPSPRPPTCPVWLLVQHLSIPPSLPGRGSGLRLRGTFPALLWEKPHPALWEILPVLSSPPPLHVPWACLPGDWGKRNGKRGRKAQTGGPHAWGCPTPHPHPAPSPASAALGCLPSCLLGELSFREEKK